MLCNYVMLCVMYMIFIFSYTSFAQFINTLNVYEFCRSIEKKHLMLANYTLIKPSFQDFIKIFGDKNSRSTQITSMVIRCDEYTYALVHFK